MTQALYYQYWGKAENDALKVAYCTGMQDKNEIFAQFKPQLAKSLKKPENQLQLSDLDEWAKKERWEYKQADYAAYHLLPYHCLDVAAVAICWWQSSKSLRQQFTHAMQVENEQQAKAWVMFFVSLHDLGKLDIRFQSKAPFAFKQLQTDIARCLQDPYQHGASSYACFVDEMSLYGISEIAACDWMQQVAGHHGVIPYNADYKAPAVFGQTFITERDQQARIDWIRDLSQLFQVNLNDVPETVPTMLAGFCSVCDWIGSSEYFTYETNSEITLEDYLNSRDVQANKALTAFGILAQLKPNETLETLFPLVTPDGQPYKPRGLQTLTEQLPLVQSLTLIEAPTGSGKTETALVYAAKLLHQGLADSIIFALPTQATANAMLDRLEAMADNLFAEGVNVVLAHGKSGLKIPNADRQTAQGQEEASQQAVRWLTASKKRAFLGQIGVCTIDQVLLSVLPVKHKFVRGFGIQKSVLIVDEVHAYDCYMYGLLKAVLRLQHQSGGSALLLSATLPQQQREDLANSWQSDIGITETYPLITQIYSNQATRCFGITDSRHLPERREVALEAWKLPELQFNEQSLQKIIDAAEQGAKIAVICNLVADAQDLAQQLTQLTRIEVDLFHSRFRFIDRQQKEEDVKALYGKEENKRTKGGRILVATQVIEQSLDLDFDWMVTQLCPVDLLFQRMGRLHRHPRTRPTGFEPPRCVVIVPEQEQKYGNSQYVYENIRVLWRTEHFVCDNDSVIFPEAYRDWIERVYQQQPWQDESSTLTEAHQKYQDNVQEVAKITAKWVTNLKIEPLPDESDRATTLTRDGEMSLTVLPVLKQQNKFYTLENEWLNEQSKQYWEQVSLSSVCVPKSWGKWLPTPVDGVIHLIMQSCDGGWIAELDDQQIIYDKHVGLFIKND